MKVEVTREDIDNGERTVARRCAVALAVRRHVPEDASVCVSPGRVSVMRKTSTGIHSLDFTPEAELRVFIRRFDSTPVDYRWALRPISFELDLPPWARRKKPEPTTEPQVEKELVTA